MSEVPDTWTATELGLVADSVQYGHTAKSSSENVGPHFLRITDIQDGSVDWSNVPYCRIKNEEVAKYLLNSDDLVFARTVGTVGKSFLIRGEIPESIFASYLIRVRLSAALVPQYTYYFFQSGDYWRQISDSSAGIGQPNVNGKKLAALQIPLPPLAEQKLIVLKIEELFSELDAGEESLRRARRQLGVYRQSLLKQAFEGKLTAPWRAQHPDLLESPDQLLTRIQAEREARYEKRLTEWNKAIEEWESEGEMGKRPTKPRQLKPTADLSPDEISFGAELPMSWAKIPAEAAGDVQLGRQRSPKNVSKDFPTKYIRAANITESGLALDDVLDMEFTPSERKAYGLQPGDLVLSEASGSPDQVGKPAMWKGEIPNCCFQNTVIRHSPFVREFSEFYLWLYRFYYAHGVFSKTAGGVGINHLSAGKFARLPVPLCSLPEQQEIVRLLDEQFEVIEQNEREIDAALKRSEALRQSILRKAFTGHLVPQDPTDEPATELLARIRAEREAAAKPAKRQTTKKARS